MLPSRVLSLRKALFQFAACPLVLVMWFVTAGINGGFGLLGILIVPAMLLAWNDLARELRKASYTPLQYAGMLAGLPQALLALFSLLGGIVIGVAYFFWPQRGEPSNWIVLLVVPALIAFGVRWLRDLRKGGKRTGLTPGGTDGR